MKRLRPDTIIKPKIGKTFILILAVFFALLSFVSKTFSREMIIKVSPALSRIGDIVRVEITLDKPAGYQWDQEQSDLYPGSPISLEHFAYYDYSNDPRLSIDTESDENEQQDNNSDQVLSNQDTRENDDQNTEDTQEEEDAKQVDVEIKDLPAVEETLANDEIKVTFTLQVFEIKRFFIAPLKIVFSKENADPIVYYTSIIPLNVLVEPLDPVVEDFVRDIKGPFYLPSFELDIPQWIIITIGVLLLSIIAGLLFYRWYKKEQRLKAHRLSTPYEIAMKDLQQLKEMELNTPEQIKEYYVRLSAIVRRYLGRVLKIFIMESTTERIKELLSRRFVPPKQLDGIYHFLWDCDMVKFANIVPDQNTINTNTEQGKDIIDNFHYMEEDREKYSVGKLEKVKELR